MRVWSWRLWAYPAPREVGDALYDCGYAFSETYRKALTIATVSSCIAATGGHLEVEPLTMTDPGDHRKRLQITTDGKPLPMLKKNGGVR